VLIRQRNQSDCAICCLAMHMATVFDLREVKDGPYGYVKNKIGDAWNEKDGLTNLSAALTRLGHVIDGPFTGFKEPTATIVTKEPDDNDRAFLFLAWGRQALITLPSLNNPPGWHMVFYDGQRVFDPSTGEQTYKRWLDLEKAQVVTIFRTLHTFDFS